MIGDNLCHILWWQWEQDVPLPALQWLIPCGSRTSSRPIFSLTWSKEGFWLFLINATTYLKTIKCDLKITVFQNQQDVLCLWFSAWKLICFHARACLIMSVVGVTCFFLTVDILFCKEPSVYVGQSERRARRSRHRMTSISTSCGLKERKTFRLRYSVFLLPAERRLFML